MGRSIDDYGGFDNFMEIMKPVHNGLGADDLRVKFADVKNPDLPYNLNDLLADFNITKPTLYNYLRRDGLLPPKGEKAKTDWL